MKPIRKARRRLKRLGLTVGQLFERLIAAILNGDFPSGAVVRESRLARAWHVSRTPLREAMCRAAESGFIVLRPNQAPLIRPLTADDIRQLYDLREVLELRALDLAWPRLRDADTRALRALAARARPAGARDWPRHCLKFDLALHGLWHRRCGNVWLAADLERHYRFLRIFQSWIGRDQALLARAHQEHVAILHALEQRDPSAARRCLRQHIRAAAKMVVSTLASRPPEVPGGRR